MDADTIRRTLDGELYFYCQVFDIQPGDAPEPIEIKNLRGLRAPS